MPLLRRITSDGSYIPQIDGLRFIAIISVVCFHLIASLGHNGAVASPLLKYASLLDPLSKRGVELFFCISGFILGLPFAKYYLGLGEPIRLKRYFLRRLTRLEPPYIVNLILCSVVVLAAHLATVKQVLISFPISVTYSNYLLFHQSSLINGITWSLEIEVQFYILAPLIAKVFSIASVRTRRIFIVSLIVLLCFFSKTLADGPLRPTIIYYMPYFLAGFLAADLYLSSRSKPYSKSFLWDIGCFAGLIALWAVPVRISPLLIPLDLVLVIVGSLQGEISSQVLSKGFLTDIGGMCYTIYLYHFLIISSVGRISKPLHVGSSFLGYFLLQALIILPVVLVICSVLFVLFERPFMDRKWPQKLAQRLMPNATRETASTT